MGDWHDVYVTIILTIHLACLTHLHGHESIERMHRYHAL